MASLTASLRLRSIAAYTFRLVCLTASLFSATILYAQNPVQIENLKTGTTDWQLTNPARTYAFFNANDDRDIEGYASSTSVNVEDSINLFVNTSASQYRIEFFRLGWYNGAGGRHMVVGQSTEILLNGQAQAIPAPDANGMVECHWQVSYTLIVPTDWVSGVYLAKLTTGATGVGRQSYIMFVVRDDARPSDYLFQSSVTTFQA